MLKSEAISPPQTHCNTFKGQRGYFKSTQRLKIIIKFPCPDIRFFCAVLISYSYLTRLHLPSLIRRTYTALLLLWLDLAWGCGYEKLRIALARTRTAVARCLLRGLVHLISNHVFVSKLVNNIFSTAI